MNWKVFEIVLFLSKVLTDGCSAFCLQTPSYLSEWRNITSQDNTLSEITFQHGLGEIPIKVIVEVKVSHGSNEYIFHAAGSAHNDDDRSDIYGGIVYLYNTAEVRVFAPNRNNGESSGRALYTGGSTSWTGPFNQDFSTVDVRVKAWKRENLPTPNFESAWIDLDVGDNSQIFQEVAHGLGDFPDMVVIQVRGLGDYISDGEGTSTILYKFSIRSFGGLVYGYSDTLIRLWIPGPFLDDGSSNSLVKGGIVSVSDGWGTNSIAIATQGTCKIYAWKFSPSSLIYRYLSSGTVDTSQQIDFTETIQTEKTLIIAEVQPQEGDNAGFRFRTAGSAMTDGINEPYGGLFYGYNSQGFVMWKPVTNSADRDGHIFSIGLIWGGAINNQSTNNVVVRLTVWRLVPEDEVRCPVQLNSEEKRYGYSMDAWYTQTANYSCLPLYTYYNGSSTRTCQRDCTWSGSEMTCEAPATTTTTTTTTTVTTTSTATTTSPAIRLQSDLRIQYKSTNRYHRSLISASDTRTSSTVLGAVITAVLFFPVVSFILSDSVLITKCCFYVMSPRSNNGDLAH